jgi:hypothetical protein
MFGKMYRIPETQVYIMFFMGNIYVAYRGFTNIKAGDIPFVFQINFRNDMFNEHL